MMTATRAFHWDDIVSQSDAKADRRVIDGKGGALNRVAVTAGSIADRHEHDFEQFFMVESGSGVLTCEDGQFLLRPGVVIHFEPNTWHRAVFETDTVLIEVNFTKR